MSRFPPDFLDEIRSRLKASDVIGRHVKLKKEGREFRGLSPFTNEKTPSFFVNDQKARFFDFSSGKSGDIINFLMETQNLSFPEAVTSLAELAGIDVPQDTPAEREREARRKTLAEASTEAARFFRAQLGRRDGETALHYLERRGVAERARARFGLGYAPDSRTALKDHLLNKDFSLEVLVEAGLLIAPEDGSAPYDRFRNRVMFPIMGKRGQVIAFGGRALSKDARAKYLNSPETPLFHKSHTLYNLEEARKRAGTSDHPVLVVEGYMDVIAVSEAGWPAVAPLGTALTEEQLSLLWRAKLQPVLCFDGDRAGRSAAYRAIDRALPHVGPGRSLRFVFLSDGLDPDDFLKAKGEAAFQALIEKARPLAEVMWDRQVETHPRETPEEAAGFRAALRDLVKTIKDADTRREYGAYFAEKLGRSPGAFDAEPASTSGFAAPSPAPFQEQRRTARPNQGRGRYQDRRPPAQMAPRITRPSNIEAWSEAILVLGLLHHPSLFERFEAEVLELDLQNEGLRMLLGRCIDLLTNNPTLDSATLLSHMSKVPAVHDIYQEWVQHPLVKLQRFIRADAEFNDAKRGWLGSFAKYRYQSDLQAEINEAAAAAHTDEGRERMWRDAVAHRSRLVSDSKFEDPSDES